MTDDVEISRTTFGMVPGWVIMRNADDGNAIRVYAFMSWRYADRGRLARPDSIESMAEDLGISVATFRRGLKGLVNTGCVLLERTRKGNGDYGRNRYRLPMDEPVTEEPAGDAHRSNLNGAESAALKSDRRAALIFERSDSIPRGNQTKEKILATSGDQDALLPESLIVSSTTDDNPIRPAGVRIGGEGDPLGATITRTTDKPTEDELLAGFDEWWKLYPRKIAKGNARKAYLAMMRKQATRDGARALWQNLMAGVRRYAAEKAGTDQQFIRHGATWLNGECWTDEPTTTPEGGARPAWHADDDRWANYDAEKDLQAAMEGAEADEPAGDLFGVQL